MRYLKRAIHLDFHTMPKIPDLGSEFNAKEFAKTLKDANVDYINAFAKCNLGFAYYPTKIGIVYPSLKCDMLGEMVRECHKQGIGISAYFNALLDHEQAIRHREWCSVDKSGRVYNTEEKMTHFFRLMCFNSGYGDYLTSLVKEVLEKYPVDGIFLDCFWYTVATAQCYGKECLDLMKKKGIDILDETKVLEFYRQSMLNFCDRIKKLVGRDKFLIFNGVPYKKHMHHGGSHIEVECLPTGGWGYESFPLDVRYARKVSKQVLGMTGRFHESWGDFGGIKSQVSLEYDCYNAISNAVGCSVGDHMHPRGKLNKEVYNLIGKVYSKIKELEPWTDHAKALTEIALLTVGDSALFPYLNNTESLSGAARMLSELKHQFDIIDEGMNFSNYKIVILSDNILLTLDLKEKIEKYLKSSGSIISSAHSGMNIEKTGFASKKWNLDYLGNEPWNISFIKPLKEINKDMPDFLTTIYKPGISVKAKKGARVLAQLYQPYFNKHWDGYHGYLYIPPDRYSGRPSIVQSENIIHFSFPIFRGYYEHAVITYRTILKNCIEKLLPKPLTIVENLPSFGRATVTEKKGRKMVHLMVYCPELRGSRLQAIEEPIIAKDIKLKLRTDRVKSVSIAPTKEKLDFMISDGYTIVNIPEVNGYQMVVFE